MFAKQPKFIVDKSKCLDAAFCTEDDGVEYTDWRTPIPKGSTVKKLSLLFPNSIVFYLKLNSFSIEIGEKVKEINSMEDGLHITEFHFGKIIGRGIFTNIRRVGF